MPAKAESVRILYARVPLEPTYVAEMLRNLPPAQQRRAEGFRPRRLAQFVTGRWLMAHYAQALSVDESRGDVVNKQPSGYEIQERDDQGPVFIVNGCKVYASVSHTASIAAVAFSDRPIGLDIEAIRAAWSAEKAALFCTAQELDTGLALEVRQQNEFFTRCWVRKEAFSKYHEVSVWSQSSREAPLLGSHRIHEFSLPDAHIGALYGDVECLSNVKFERVRTALASKRD